MPVVALWFKHYHLHRYFLNWTLLIFGHLYSSEVEKSNAYCSNKDIAAGGVESFNEAENTLR